MAAADHRPPAVVRASNLGLDTPLSHRLFGLLVASAAVSLAVLFSNHRGTAKGERPGGSKKKKPQHTMTVLVTDVLAGITLANGVLAFFGACMHTLPAG